MVPLRYLGFCQNSEVNIWKLKKMFPRVVGFSFSAKFCASLSKKSTLRQRIKVLVHKKTTRMVYK